MVCKILICMEFPNIPDEAGRIQEEEKEDHR